MFFPHLIRNIKPHDKVLEIGPGGTPHPQATVFLEKNFSELEAVGQRGYAKPLQTNKRTVYFDGGKFPFNDNEFDYVICSHVLEHVENIESFIYELQRVAAKGYIEFPTIYYDHLYNFPEHVTLLFYKNDTIFYLPKNETPLNNLKPVTHFFYRTLELGHYSFINEMKQYFFQGFEWTQPFRIQKAKSLEEITYDKNHIKIHQSWFNRLLNIIKK